MFQFLVPFVLFFVIQSVGQETDRAEVIGVHTTTPNNDTQDTKQTETPTSTESDNNVHVESDSSHQSSSVNIVEGNSSVNIDINNSSSGDSTTNGSSISLNEFSYPGAKSIESSSSRLILETSDNTDTVTNWYEQKIESLGGGSQSVVRTNSNGNVLNKLGTGFNGKSIIVEISGTDGSSVTKITVNLN